MRAVGEGNTPKKWITQKLLVFELPFLDNKKLLAQLFKISVTIS